MLQGSDVTIIGYHDFWYPPQSRADTWPLRPLTSRLSLGASPVFFNASSPYCFWKLSVCTHWNKHLCLRGFVVCAARKWRDGKCCRGGPGMLPGVFCSIAVSGNQPVYAWLAHWPNAWRWSCSVAPVNFGMQSRGRQHPVWYLASSGTLLYVHMHFYCRERERTHDSTHKSIVLNL